MRRISVLRRAALACAAVTTLGSGNAQAQGFIGRVFGDRYYEDIKGKFIDVAPQKANQIREKAQKEGTRGYVAGTVSGTLEYDAVPLPTVEARGNEIMAKLLAQWPGDKPTDLKIVVTANPIFGAESSSSKTISVSQGVLRNIESDDEFAAIIGHELGHIVLNHFARSEAYEREAKLIADVSTVAVMGVVLAGTRVTANSGGVTVGLANQAKTGDQVMKAMLIGFAIETISSMFNADWGREQEDEADLLSVDLMARAGYNVDAATAVLDRLRQTRATAKVDLDKFANMYGQALAAAAVQGGVEGFKQQLSVVAIDAAIRGGRALIEDITKSHPDPKRRWEDVGHYVAREYQEPFDDAVADAHKKSYAAMIADKRVAPILSNHDAAATALRALQLETPDLPLAISKSTVAVTKPTDRAPYALRSLGKVRMVQSDGAGAVKALSVAAADPGASFATVTLYASALAQTGNFPLAHATLDQAASKFNSQEAIYPARIEVYRIQGDKAKMDEMVATCSNVENQEIRAKCRASQKDGNAQGQENCDAKETGLGKLFCGMSK